MLKFASMIRLSLIFWIIIPFWSYAQDMIVLKDNSTISVRIVQEDKESVVFLPQNDTTTVIQQLSKDKVKKTKYEKIRKSVNVIVIVHDSLSKEHLLIDVINHLIVSGYIIESFDNKYYTVITEYVSKERVSAEIVDNKAFFRCFYLEEEVNLVYPHASGVVAWGKKPKPGEKRGSPGSSAFKHLDKVVRSYLMDGKGILEYKTEIE
jgi:hypothetical protein